MKHIERARIIRTKLDTITSEMTDEQAIDNSVLFTEWDSNGHQYKVGDRFLYQDKVYKVIQPHTSQPDWKPDITPALYLVITVEEWAEWQPNTFYAKGAKVTHNNKKWVSNVDNNHWEPGSTGVYTWDEWTGTNE